MTDQKASLVSEVSDRFLGLATWSSTAQRFSCQQAVVEHYINENVTSVVGYPQHRCPDGHFSQ